MNYDVATERLRRAFEQAQEHLLGESSLSCDSELKACLDALFEPSITQAFREALLGCTLARLDDLDNDARRPYVQHGKGAYSGRSLDEKVVNPYLIEQRIPASKGPFLSVFRRSVGFNEETGRGIRDREAFARFLDVVQRINAANETDLDQILALLAYRFLVLREVTTIRLSKLRRISHEQYAELIHNLLETPSGGRFPMFLVEAVFHAIRESFDLDWEILAQGINVADGPTGATGDIEIRSQGRTVLAAEVTERVVDKHRVRATFETKIAVAEVHDYLFLVKVSPQAEARIQARQYFSQGHEVNFADIKTYILAALLSVGAKGRQSFNRVLTSRIDAPDVPAALKVAWNEHIQALTAV
ncbi:MAG: restriction endonuclease, SacI family [Bryobacterales bacterium]|nr:restriction endonuclease, SacI family [Bryobacterales bacterium]